MNHAIQGVHCAAATPVGDDGRPNLALFVDHCRKLLNEGCHGIAMLGTTSEANSIAIPDRIAMVEAAIDGGIAANTLLPGVSTPSIHDTIALTRHAVEAGAKGVVMLPPYYYKDVSDEGLFRFYASVIEGVADDRLRIILYHIPQVSQVPLSHDLIDRLLTAFPSIVCGLKDSSGDMDHMASLCKTFPQLGVLAGADPLMLPLLKLGGAGCITAASNFRADALRVVWDNWQDPDKADQIEVEQARITEWRALSTSYVQIPTVKAMVARHRGDKRWIKPMAPLVEISDEECQTVWQAMDDLTAKFGPAA